MVEAIHKYEHRTQSKEWFWERLLQADEQFSVTMENVSKHRGSYQLTEQETNYVKTKLSQNEMVFRKATGNRNE